MEIAHIDVLTITHKEVQELAYSPSTCSRLDIDFDGPQNSFWVKSPTEGVAEIRLRDIDIHAYIQGGFPESVTFQGHDVGQLASIDYNSGTHVYTFLVVLNGMCIPELQKISKKVNIEWKRISHPLARGF